MNKKEFLAELRKSLSGLPQDDIEERLLFYSEIIDDRVEEGLSEEDAVSGIGSVDEIVKQIVAETPLPKLVKEKTKSKRGMKAWEIVLLVLGFPLWFSLLIAALAVVLSLYVVLWSVIIALWSVAVSLAACVIGGIVSALVFSFTGEGLTGIAILGAGIFCFGISIFAFFGCKAATKGILILTKKIALVIKSMFVGKENTK